MRMPRGHCHLRWSRIALPAAAMCLAGSGTGRAQSPEWNAFLNVRPAPSPYIADWESDPSLVTLVLSYSGSGGVAFHLDGLKLEGIEVPRPRSYSSYVDVA